MTHIIVKTQHGFVKGTSYLTYSSTIIEIPYWWVYEG